MMRNRIITGLILFGVGVSTIYFGGYFLFVALLLITLLMTKELSDLLKRHNKHLHLYPLFIAQILTYASLLFPQTLWIWTHPFSKAFVTVLVLLQLSEVFLKKAFLPDNTLLLSTRVFAMFTLTTPYLYLLRESEHGMLLMAFVLTQIWAFDTMSYFGGKRFGSQKLSSLSPKKTIEGALIGGVSTLLVSLGFCLTFSLPIAHFLPLSVLIIPLALIGDIHQSLLKRICSAKDAADFLPGHGGFYDRNDSSLLTIPILFFLMV